MKCDEIFAALAMLEKERGIPQDFMMNKIVQALTPGEMAYGAGYVAAMINRA